MADNRNKPGRGNGTRPASAGRTNGNTRNTAGSGTGRASSGSRTSSGGRKTSGQRAYVGNARDVARARRNGQTAGRSSAGSTHERTGTRHYDDGEQLKLRLEEDDSLKDEIAIILVLLVGILLVLSFLNLCGAFGTVVNSVIFGLMGWFGYAFPFVMVFVAIFAIANKRNRSIVAKTLLFAGMMIFISALVQIAAGGFDETITLKDYYTNSIPEYLGDRKTYGGFFGGLICKLLCPYVGKAAAVVIMCAAVIIFFLLIVGKALFTAIARRGIETAEELRARRHEEEEYEAEEHERMRKELEAEHGRQVIDQGDGAASAYNRGRRQKTQEVVPDDFDDDGFDENDEVFSKPPRKSRKNGFIDSIIRTGMGLEVDRIADTPEYQKLKDTYGITAEEVEEIEKKEENGPQDGDGRIGQDPGITENKDLSAGSEDIVARELARKFSSNPGIDVVPLRDHPRVTRVDNPLMYMVDEEDEKEEPAGFDTDTVSLDARRKEQAAKTGMQPYDMKKGFEGRPEPAERKQETGEETRTVKEPAVKEPAGKNSAPNNGAASFTTPEQLAKLREENENRPEPPYVFPPISLLNKGQGNGRNYANSNELKETVNRLQQTFESFGVGVKVTDATVGPTVTRYELLPDQGVKVKTITSLADDIKLALAAAEIRIEAPIPGKAAVGIEVPNATTSPVLLRDLLDTPEFRDAQSKLTFAVGKDIAGKSICFDIGSMPHMLIAGATGSGKSVCINALILSILYKAKPSEVKLVMIDPKRVELIGYNGIPHLLVPVVTDVKKATGALNWAIAEMDDRYERFANKGVNNLKSYNNLVEEEFNESGQDGECPDKLPQILIIVDELNDLMMTANSKEVEGAICRLTQLARAAGIHVVLATQRPSVNVITGTIKANIPSRIAFSVSSLVDSRTILDQSGAEKLLGKGDMLFYPQGYPKPVRLQGAYVSDKEIAGVVDFIKSKCKEVKYSDKVSEHIDKNAAKDPKSGSSSSGSGTPQTSESEDGRDEFFVQAGRFIIEKQKASIGMLQRVYKIGFNRAARIMDQLAEEGIVGPEEGTKPRKILMTLPEFEAYIGGNASEGEDAGE